MSDEALRSSEENFAGLADRLGKEARFEVLLGGGPRWTPNPLGWSWIRPEEPGVIVTQLPEEVTRIRWTLEEDGSGLVQVWKAERDETTNDEAFFYSLDDLPAEIASVILADGREAGELPRN